MKEQFKRWALQNADMLTRTLTKEGDFVIPKEIVPPELSGWIELWVMKFPKVREAVLLEDGSIAGYVGSVIV